MVTRKTDNISVAGGLGCAGFFLVMLVAWCTHMVWIIDTLASDKGATLGQIVLGVLGAFMPPVGIVHGVMIWFGVGF